jgi:outer membrane protein assembly factor BamB
VGLPADWDANSNVAWKTKIPGYGWSGPIVWGDKILVTSAVSEKQKKPSGGFGSFAGGFGKGDFGKGGIGKGGFGKGGFGKGGFAGAPPPDVVYEWELCCLDATDGKVLWKQTVAKQKPAIATNPTNGYATETPATDGERVYTYFGGIGVVFCYDLAGNFVWKADIGAHPVQFGHGTASSPVVHNGRLFIQCDNERNSFLLALDAKTGKEVWRTPRTERTGWSTPLVWTNNVRTEVVCVGSPKIRSYDPNTGKQLWELGGVEGQIKASAVADDELLYVGSGGGFGGFGGGFPARPGGEGARFGGSKPLYAVKAGAVGDITLKSGAARASTLAGTLPKPGQRRRHPFYIGAISTSSKNAAAS